MSREQHFDLRCWGLSSGRKAAPLRGRERQLWQVVRLRRTRFSSRMPETHPVEETRCSHSPPLPRNLRASLLRRRLLRYSIALLQGRERRALITIATRGRGRRHPSRARRGPCRDRRGGPRGIRRTTRRGRGVRRAHSGSEEFVPELALVAEDSSGVIAHVMLSWVGVEGGSRTKILNLTPMSVRPDRQRIGVGSRLIRDALGRAEEAGEPAVMVEGIPRTILASASNVRARSASSPRIRCSTTLSWSSGSRDTAPTSPGGSSIRPRSTLSGTSDPVSLSLAIDCPSPPARPRVRVGPCVCAESANVPRSTGAVAGSQRRVPSPPASLMRTPASVRGKRYACAPRRLVASSLAGEHIKPAHPPRRHLACASVRGKCACGLHAFYGDRVGLNSSMKRLRR